MYHGQHWLTYGLGDSYFELYKITAKIGDRMTGMLYSVDRYTEQQAVESFKEHVKRLI